MIDKDAEGGKQGGKSADKSHESSPNKVLLLSSKKNLDPLSHGESSARARNQADAGQPASEIHVGELPDSDNEQATVKEVKDLKES